MNMKLKHILTSILFIVSFALYAQSWQNVEDFTAVGGNVLHDNYNNTTDFIFNSNDQSIVAYSRASDKQLIVLYFDGTIWNSLGDLSFLNINISQVEIEIVSNGNIFIAFTDDNYQQLSIIKFDGISWVYVAQNIAGDKALGIDMAKDTFDNIYIAYEDNLYGNKATLKKYDFITGNIFTVGNEGFTPTIVEDLKLAINPLTSEPFVVYNFNGKAYVYKFIGSTWNQVGSDFFSTYFDNNTGVTYDKFVVDTDIEFSSNGELLSCTCESLYYEYVRSGTYCYKFENNNWASTPISDGTKYINMKSDGIGNIYYTSSKFNTTLGEYWGLYFGKYNNGNYENLTAIETGSHGNSFLQINFDNQNTPFVIYSRFLIVNSHIRKFTNNLGINEFNQNNFVVFPNPSQDFITVTNLSQLSKFELYDIHGKSVLTGNISNDKKIDLRSLNKGVYFLKIEELNTLKIIKK
jgi:hypothetical protein